MSRQGENMNRITLSIVAILAAALIGSAAFAKLPAPPPVDPAKAEEAKQKAAEAAKAGAVLQAKYEDKAAANYAAKAKAAGTPFNPKLGPGVPPPPAPAAPAAAPTPATAAVVASPAAAAPKK